MTGTHATHRSRNATAPHQEVTPTDGIRNGRPYRRLVVWQKALGLPYWICSHYEVQEWWWRSPRVDLVVGASGSS